MEILSFFQHGNVMANTLVIIIVTAICFFRATWDQLAGTMFSDMATERAYLRYRGPLDAEKGNGYRQGGMAASQAFPECRCFLAGCAILHIWYERI